MDENREDRRLEVITKMQHSSILSKEVIFNLFLPIHKLSHNSILYKDFVKNSNKRIIKYENVIVEQRNRLLTEIHKDVVSAIIQFGKISLTQDGKICSVFQEKDILRELKMGEKNHQQLREYIKIITDVTYYITIEGYTKNLRIFDKYLTVDGASKRVQGVIFDDEYVRMHRDDFSIDYKKIFKKIKGIEYATIPTILKFLMVDNKTTTPKTYKLEEILSKINFPTESNESLKKIKRHMKDYTVKLKEDYNVDYDAKSKNLIYSKMQDIRIIDELDIYKSELDSFIGKKFKHKNYIYTIQEFVNIFENKEWLIKTNIEDLTFNLFVDDLIFYLKQTTDMRNKGSLFNLLG